MKKILLATLITSTSFYASADMLVGGDIEMNLWQQKQTFNYSNNELDGGSNTATTFEGSIEHFIPLIPNVKFAQSAVEGHYIEYVKRDFTLYYEFLDNDVVSFDAGVGLTRLTDGKFTAYANLAGYSGSYTQEFEGYVPHLYAAAEIGIVGTPLFVFAKGSGIAYEDNNMLDVSVGVQYSIPLVAFDLELQGGYRSQSFNLEDFDSLSIDIDAKTDGIFAGVNIDF